MWKYCCVEYLRIFLPMFSSWTFMVLWLIFKSLIHIEFTFVYGVSWWSSFIFLHVVVHITQHHLLKRLFLLHLCFFPLCRILIDHGDLDLFLGSLCYSIDLCFLFWLLWPCNIVWYQIFWSLLLCSSFSKLLTSFSLSSDSPTPLPHSLKNANYPKFIKNL